LREVANGISLFLCRDTKGKVDFVWFAFFQRLILLIASVAANRTIGA
jgi:hypothetical protein